MRSRFLAVLLGVCGVALLSTSDTRAYPNCQAGDSASGTLWPTVQVKIYIYNTTQTTPGPGQGLRYAVGQLSESDIEMAIMRTVHDVNEEVGGKIKLQYAGTTSSSSPIANAIILRSAPHDCSDGHDGQDIGALEYTDTVASGGVRTSSTIYYYKYGGSACSLIAHDLTGNFPDDLGRTTIHELGHGFYDVGHPNEAFADCNYPTDLSYPTHMMNMIYRRGRLIKDWDREIFQKHHIPRSTNSSLWRSYRNATGWQSAFTTPFSPVMLYRPGSMSQNVSYRTFGYIYQNSYSPNPVGGGQIRGGRYEATAFGYADTPTNEMMRPVATASKPGTTELFVAYVKRANGTYGADSEVGKVCYRISTNGTSYGSETCQPTWLVYTNGLTAAYSARGDSYVIGFAGDNYTNYVATVPATGSTFPIRLTSAGAVGSSWHAPAVACRSDGGDGMGCRAVWEDKTNAGCTTIVKFGFDVISHHLSFGTPTAQSPCLTLFDTPGLAYSPVTDSFEMASTWWNDTIYSYNMASAGSAFGYDGDIWAVPGSFVLSPALTFRPAGVSPRFQAWFVKYYQP